MNTRTQIINVGDDELGIELPEVFVRRFDLRPRDELTIKARTVGVELLCPEPGETDWGPV